MCEALKSLVSMCRRRGPTKGKQQPELQVTRVKGFGFLNYDPAHPNRQPDFYTVITQDGAEVEVPAKDLSKLV